MGLFGLLGRVKLKGNAFVLFSSIPVASPLQVVSLYMTYHCLPNSIFLREFRYPDRSLKYGFSSSASKPPKADPFSENGEKKTPCSGEVSKDADRICFVLVNQAASSVDAAVNQLQIQISQDLVVEVLKKLGNAGAIALSFFRWASNQNGVRRTTEMYHHLIEALGKIKQFRVIWDLVNAMSGGGMLSKETFSLISRRYVRAKKIKEAIGVLEKMTTYGFTAELSDFNCLIDSICKSKNVMTAQQLVHEMKKRGRFTPDLKTYTILLEGWAQHMHIAKLTQVYQELMDEGFEPDQVTYGILIHAFCKCRMLVQALKIFDEMEARNIKPGPYIYCNLINGLGADKRLDDALKFFKKFIDNGFPPELPTYNATVGAYCWSQQYEQAYIMVDEMKRLGVGPNTRTYDVILSHLIRAKRYREAYRLFQRMDREDGCNPELNTYTMMMRMFCAAEKVDMAIMVWKQMNMRGVLPCTHMFSVLISRLCYENRLEEACRFFEEMLDRGLRPPGLLYSNLIRALEGDGKSDWAVKIGRRLDQLRRTPLEG